MNINIMPKKHDTYDCFQNNIIAILGDYFKIDYRPFFWGGDFRFSIDKSKNDINITGYNTCQEKVLFQQCDVKIEYIDRPFCVQKFVQIIVQELQHSKPIGFRLNGSELPWNKNKNIDYHYLLIVGIDLPSSRLYCYDSFIVKKIQTIDIFSLHEKVESMLIYHISDKNINTFNISQYAFLECLKQNNSKKLKIYYILKIALTYYLRKSKVRIQVTIRLFFNYPAFVGVEAIF